MLNLYFVYNGHCKFFLGSFNNVDELIEQMKDHQWAFSGITRPKFKKHIGKDDVRFDYGAVDCYYLATKSTCMEHTKTEYGSVQRNDIDDFLLSVENYDFQEAEMVEEFVDFQSCLLMYGIDFELRNGVE